MQVSKALMRLSCIRATDVQHGLYFVYLLMYLVNPRNRGHEEDQAATKFEVLCSQVQQVPQALLKCVCISRGNVRLCICDHMGFRHRLLASGAHPVRRVADDSIKYVLRAS